MTRRVILVLVCLAVWAGTMSTALAQDQAAAIEELKKEMRELRQEVNQKQKKIEALEQRLDAVQKTVSATPAKEPVKAAAAKTEPATPQAALDQAVQVVEAPKAEKGKVETAKGEAALDQAVKAVQAPQEPARPSLLSYKAGGATLRLIDVSFDIMGATRGVHQPPTSNSRMGCKAGATIRAKGVLPYNRRSFPWRGRRPVFQRRGPYRLFSRPGHGRIPG